MLKVFGHLSHRRVTRVDSHVWRKSHPHPKSIFLRHSAECDRWHFDGLPMNAPTIIEALNNTCGFRCPLWRFIGQQLSFRPEGDTHKHVEPAHSPSESSADTGSSKCACCVKGAACKHGHNLKVSSTVTNGLVLAVSGGAIYMTAVRGLPRSPVLASLHLKVVKGLP